MAEFNVFHWLTITVIFFVLLYYSFLKIIMNLLTKVGVRQSYTRPIIDSIWLLFFKSISALILHNRVKGNWYPMFWEVQLAEEFKKCKEHRETTFQEFKTIVVLFTAFLIQDFVNILITDGIKNFKCLQKKVVLAVFTLAIYKRCTTFALSFFFMSNFSDVFIIGSRLVLLLSKYTDFQTLRNVSKSMLAFGLYWWTITYFYSYLAFLTRNTSIGVSSSIKADHSMIIIETMAWIHLLLTIVTSTLLRVIASYVKSEQPCSMEWILNLPQNEMITIQVENNLDSTQPYSSNVQTLHSTVLCRNLIMRKVKAMREKKKSLENSNSSEETNQNSKNRVASNL